MQKEGQKELGDPVSKKLYMAGSKEALSELVDVGSATSEDIEEISQLMRSLARLRETEKQISDSSQRYMRLGSQEMRALHYLIVAKRQNQIVTPGMLSAFLEISPASTTKLLNRLERGNHIIRQIHPSDRRAFSIEITPQTEISARQTVGKLQARRFYAAARLSSSERALITRFLDDMTNELSPSNAPWIQESGDR